ncbi:MAG: ACT domain-containing protein [Anaerolineae bacterium]|nr:ACT domain-containing protein [Anaerolineae bacterium]
MLDVSPPYRLITFDIPLDWGVIGYLAALTSELAEAGISIIALSAFSRDHIFVAEIDFDRAWDVLDTFIRACREQVANLAAPGEFV